MSQKDMKSDSEVIVEANRLLILACSQRKRSDPESLPAIERYDGPAYRVLRKYTREVTAIQTWILSAEYGLIPGEQHIPAYDRRMDSVRAQELKPQILSTIDVLASGNYLDVLVCTGQVYTSALSDIAIRLGCPVTFTEGPIGGQVAILRDWLYGEPSNPPLVSDTRPIIFRGQQLCCTADEVLYFARQRANEDPIGACHYISWYIPVGECRFAPKWLLSQLTSIPVSHFRTADALRVLTALGIEVRRA